MSLVVPFVIFLFAQTAWVVSYTLSRLDLMKDQQSVFLGGVICLTIVTLGPYLLFRRYYQNPSMWMSVFSVFSWTCMIDLGIGLELDGYISNFMGFYFAEGEPYLMTAHGTVIDYWDGIAHFTMYLAIIGLYANKKSHREVGLYWVGSMVNSMIVLLQGGIAGNHPFKLPILLNVPYMLLPVLAGYKFLHDRPPQARTFLQFRPIWRRPVDLLFFLYFIVAIGVALFRGMAALGGNAEAMKEYLKAFEPYIVDSTGFPKFQILTYGYFFFVYYLGAAYGLVCPGQHWMADWALIHAGAAGQAQYTYILGSIHHRTPKALHPPMTGIPAIVSWSINIGLAIVPHLFACWCLRDVEHFGRTYSVERADVKEDGKAKSKIIRKSD